MTKETGQKIEVKDLLELENKTVYEIMLDSLLRYRADPDMGIGEISIFQIETLAGICTDETKLIISKILN